MGPKGMNGEEIEKFTCTCFVSRSWQELGYGSTAEQHSAVKRLRDDKTHAYHACRMQMTKKKRCVGASYRFVSTGYQGCLAHFREDGFVGDVKRWLS